MHALRLGIGLIGVARGDGELGHTSRVIPAGRGGGPQRGALGDENPSVLGEARVKRKAEQTPFLETPGQGDHPVAKVEKGRGELLPVSRQNMDQARLIGDEAPPAQFGR